MNNGFAPTYNVINATTTQVLWGVPVATNRSSYLVSANVFDPVEVTAGNPSAEFVFGNFTHNNFPIFAPWMQYVQLRVTGDVTVDGLSIGAKTFVYDFYHVETPNSPSFPTPCTFGGPNLQGINVNGCADAALNVFSSASETFTVGGQTYSMELHEFRIGGDDYPVFYTLENQVNNAQLVGRFNLLANIPQLAPAIPEPGTWAMMLGGFGMIGAAMRRRRRAATLA